MASTLALRRAAATSLLNKLINPIRSAAVAPSVTRSFNTNAQMTNYDDDERDDRELDVDRRRDSRVSRRRRDDFFSDAFDPFSPATRSLSQILNAMDHMMENPFTAPSPRGLGLGLRPGWYAKEDESSLSLRFDMPGLDKENVKISVEQNTLVIKGEGEKEADEEEPARKYSSRLELPPKMFKLDEIKAELKNGVLKIRVPKLKEEERKDVRQVTIE